MSIILALLAVPSATTSPAVPQLGSGITIHHLLTHTSGLSTRLSDKLYRKIERGTTGTVTSAEQADYLGLNSEWPVGAQPGEQYAYNNFGYILLAHIIEEVSGQPMQTSSSRPSSRR